MYRFDQFHTYRHVIADLLLWVGSIEFFKKGVGSHFHVHGSICFEMKREGMAHSTRKKKTTRK
jgi:hypothetical protein